MGFWNTITKYFAIASLSWFKKFPYFRPNYRKIHRRSTLCMKFQIYFSLPFFSPQYAARRKERKEKIFSTQEPAEKIMQIDINSIEIGRMQNSSTSLSPLNIQ